MLKYHQRHPFVITWLIIVAIALLTLPPAPEVADEVVWIPYADKMVHLLMFGALATTWWWERTLRHGRETMSWRWYVVTGVYVSLIGAADELLQGLLQTGRSGDVLDWVADVVGAFGLPPLARPLIEKWLPRGAVRLITLHRLKAVLSKMEHLYMESFPVEERRQWPEIVAFATSRNHPLHFTVITYGGEPCGFLTWWRIGRMRYVEHFADARATLHGDR